MRNPKPIKNIPVYSLVSLSGNTGIPDVSFKEHQISNPDLLINIPYRSNYFGIGICVAGETTLQANLETFTVEKNCVIAMSPPVIKQWGKMSEDYKTYTVLFTKDLFVRNNGGNIFLDGFAFFEPNARHVWPVSKQQTKKIRSLLKDIQRRLNSVHPYRTEIAKSLITILLFEIAAMYNNAAFPVSYKQTRSEQLVADFKKLMCTHFHKERSVSFYAKLLFVTPRHLTEVVKKETGRPAKEWIDELIILESKVLLQDPSVSIAAIADALNFADQSVFGKFFKNLTGLSPLAYRQKG